MQSPGPSYPGIPLTTSPTLPPLGLQPLSFWPLSSGLSYTDRPYDNQMSCQTAGYTSYQPPSPYRPHPVSPQYGGSQMYGSYNQHYGGQDMYNRHSLYSPRPAPPGDIMSYNQPSPRPSMLPPPSMHSPSYRQLTAGTHSPHSWSQIPSPATGAMHSPRTTPSPAHTRSPAHNPQPFSPPAPTSPAVLHKADPSPPSNRRSACSSPVATVQPGGNNDPLQSLQKMVMLDGEPRAAPPPYESAPPRPGSYFTSVEQLAGGSDPGSPYPTYYNLDQNRLCTPPRNSLSTPSSTTYTSAPDSTSSSSPRSDPAVAADSTAPVNGEIPLVSSQPEFSAFVANGQPREELSHMSSDSENKESQDFYQDTRNSELSDRSDMAVHKSPKSPRGRGKPFPLNCTDVICDLSMDGSNDKIPKNKAVMWSMDKRNSTLQEFEITNGQLDDNLSYHKKYNSNNRRFYSPTTRWVKPDGSEDSTGYSDLCPPEGYVPAPTYPSIKRGPRRRRGGYIPMGDEGGHPPPEWDPMFQPATRRKSAGRSPGRRGGRRRGSGRGAVNYNDRPHAQYDNSYHPYYDLPPGTTEMGDEKEGMDSLWPRANLSQTSQGISDDCITKDDLTSNSRVPYTDNGPMNICLQNSQMFPPLSPSANQSLDATSPGSSYPPPPPPPYPQTANDMSMHSSKPPTAPSATPRFQESQPGAGTGTGPPPGDPPKKKRGRPFGSKNKPKPPGEQPTRKRRRKCEILADIMAPAEPKPLMKGPYVKLVGSKCKPSVVSVVNAEQPRGVPPRPVPHPMLLGAKPLVSDPTRRDRCALCYKNGYYRHLGALFGPYSLSEEPQPPPSDVATPRSATPGPDDDNDSGATPSPANEWTTVAAAWPSGPRIALSRKVRKSCLPEMAHQVREDEETHPTSCMLPVDPTGEVWVHEDCVVWSPGVYQQGHVVLGLDHLILEASKTMCSWCQGPGASVPCLVGHCTERYHYLCAKDGGCEMREVNFTVLCPRHKPPSPPSCLTV